MREFARKPAEERARLLAEAAARRGIGAHLVEKDFWVCWLLRLIFADEEIGGHLVFKGGTSLAKVFGIIQRFSEDIDLSVDPVWLGFAGEASLEAAPSRSQFDKRAEELEEACVVAVRDRFWPALHRHIAATLPSTPMELTFEVDEGTHSPVLLFAYPRTGRGTGSLRPHVKLEFGSLYDQRPTGTHAILPLVAEYLPTLFREPSCRVVALEAERTFWEKATLLHAEYHRAADSALPIGISRHYYDLYCLGRHETGRRALGDLDMLARVRAHKQTFFRSGWAHYETALPGTLRLAPSPERRAQLERDYRGMADMFTAPPPLFETIVAGLEDLERQIHGA